MKINVLRAILIILLLGTFWLIFGFSSQDAKTSSGVSKEVSKTIVNITSKHDSEANKKKKVKSIEPVIRKIAHFSIYTVVGFLLMALMCTYNLKNKKRIIISIIIGFIYACSDELHQTFVTGRSGEVRDVLIDTSGVVVGIGICMGIIKLWKIFKAKKYNKK